MSKIIRLWRRTYIRQKRGGRYNHKHSNTAIPYYRFRTYTNIEKIQTMIYDIESGAKVYEIYRVVPPIDVFLFRAGLIENIVDNTDKVWDIIQFNPDYDYPHYKALTETNLKERAEEGNLPRGVELCH